jgi:hypothetical protein
MVADEVTVGEDVTPAPDAEEEGLLDTVSTCKVSVDGGNVSTISVIVCGADDEAAAEVSWNWAVPEPVMFSAISSAEAEERKRAKNNILTTILQRKRPTKGNSNSIDENCQRELKEVKGFQSARFWYTLPEWINLPMQNCLPYKVLRLISTSSSETKISFLPANRTVRIVKSGGSFSRWRLAPNSLPLGCLGPFSLSIQPPTGTSSRIIVAMPP